MTFHEKLGFPPTVKNKKICKLIMNLIPNDWKQLRRTETSKKSLLKKFSIFTTTIKTLGKQKTSENFLIEKFIYFNLHSNSTKHNKLFKFALWSNVPEEHHVLESCVKILLIGLKKCSDGYIFYIWYKLSFPFFPLLKPYYT